MPRIDPLQLLKCLSVLLSPEGGILSRDEVPRLVNLMTKFSKKLVSKCVYVLILKNTETSLVDMFMAEGGWTLIQTWLQDGAQSGNWDLVKEILGLLLITPVDVERLKMNCLPKLIKNLSRREDLDGVSQLSNQIVQNWLIIVKGCAQNASSAPPSTQAQLEKRKSESVGANVEEQKLQITNQSALTEIQNEINEDSSSNSTENEQAIKTGTFYKSATKESKEVNNKSTEDDKSSTDSNNVEEEAKSEEIKDAKLNEKDGKSKEKDKEKSSKSSSSSRSKSSSSSSRDKDRDKDRKRSSHSSSTKSKSSSSSSSRDKDRKDRDRDRKDKDRSRHGSSSKSSSSKSSSKDKESRDKSKSGDSKDYKETKENQAEKDKDTLQKLKPQTLDKLGRIPKKAGNAISDEKQKENKTENKPKEILEKDLAKKPSFSILNRKASGEERTKTVKVFNSKMRSTGLEEEAKPPPPRSAKKPNPSVQLPTIPPKRPSPPRETSTVPPEKKLKIDKIDVPERPGAIKLIPPKPKPPVLQESDMFMDALTAAAPKKEAKKRKRRPSVTKDAPSSPTSTPGGGDPSTPTSPTPTSPTQTALGLKNIAPINFYQDTLSEEPENPEEKKNDDSNTENKENTENITNSPENNDTPASPEVPSNAAEAPVEKEIEPSSPKIMKTDGLKGVLLYSKKKGPKRSIHWKVEEELVEIRYFELDETERINVTKTFGDMAKMDISSEREALIMSRKPAIDDFMEPQLMWRLPYICDQPENLAASGSKSLEKDIQFAREKTVLPAIYFDKRRIPDSSEEPIPENHQMSDPVIIPLEDPESQEIDLRSTPWPEPKGPPPQMEPQPMPPIFPNMAFNPNFNNMGNIPPGPPFVGVPPRFPAPTGPLGPMGPGPGPFVPPNMIHNNMMGPPMNPPEIMNQGPVNSPMYGPDGFMGPVNEPNFPIQQFNGPPGPNMNMFGQNNFNHRGGNDGEGRGGFRRGGGNNGGWVRMNGPRNNWKRGRGGGSRGGRLCKNIQNHGYCRNGDNCPFVH